MMDREDLFREASRIRSSLRSIERQHSEGTLTHEAYRDEIMRVRLETFDLMSAAQLPQAFVALVTDLWGGAASFIGIATKSRAFHLAARLDAATPGLSKKALSAQINVSLGDRTDRRQSIGRWREDREYQRLIEILRGGD